MEKKFAIVKLHACSCWFADAIQRSEIVKLLDSRDEAEKACPENGASVQQDDVSQTESQIIFQVREAIVDEEGAVYLKVAK